MAAALAVAVLGLAFAFLAAGRATPVPQRAPAIAASPRAGSPAAAALPMPTSTVVPVGWWTDLAAPRQLALPAGVVDVALEVIPDRYLNEPPPAWFRIAVTVRGTPGLASVEPPAALMWTEGGLAYSLSSPTLSEAELIKVASALR